MKYLIITLAVFYFWSCSREPQAIIYNEDNCTYCKMLISDQRYGAEIITAKGKNYKYDSVECLAAALLTDKASLEIHSIWIIDFNNPEQFTDAEKACYLHSELLKSPMGMNFSAFSSREMAETVKNVYPGSLLQWAEVKEMVKKEWLADK